MSSLLRLCRTAILPGGTEGILLLPTEVGLRSVATLEPRCRERILPFPRVNTPSVSMSPRPAFCVRPVRGRKCGAHACRVWRRPRSCRHSHPSRQSPLRLLGLPPCRSCCRRPPSCRQCRHLPPPDADPPRPPHPSASEWSRAVAFRSLLSHHADAPRVGVLLFG